MSYSPLCDTNLVAYLAYIAACERYVELFRGTAKRGLVLDGKDPVAEAAGAGGVLEPGSPVLGVGAFGDGGVARCEVGCVVARVFSVGESAEAGGRCVGCGSSWRCVKRASVGRSTDQGAGVGVGGGAGDSNPAGGVGEYDARVSCEDAARGVEASVVSDRTLANRAKRVRKRLAKSRKRGEEVSSRCEEAVPEWRQKGVRATFHKGAFADCSDGVRQELRDSRAKMLIEKNRVAVVEAEHRRRTVEARLKSRMVEEEVEKKRLELAAENQRLLEARLARQPAGYAETLASLGIESVLDAPSLSTGSVSPDSSISVAELKRREAALTTMAARIAELELQVSKGSGLSAKKKKKEGSVAAERSSFYREGDVCLRGTDERRLYSQWT